MSGIMFSDEGNREQASQVQSEVFSILQFEGKVDDVVLGYDNLKGYLNGSDGSYIGAIVGRVANRIKGAQFTIDGKLYHISPNEGKNTLHGGKKGFDKMIWGVEDKELDGKNPAIEFVYHSYDGEEGWPFLRNL